MNRAINHLVLAIVDSFKKFKNKLAYYFAIFAMVFGSTFGTFNAANAVETMVLSGASTAGPGTMVTLSDDKALLVNGSEALNMSTHAATLTIADDAADQIFGAITGTTGKLTITSVEETDAATQTFSTYTGTDSDIQITTAGTQAHTVIFTGAVTTGAVTGTIVIDGQGTQTVATLVQVGGDLTGVVSLDDNDGTVTLEMTGDNTTIGQTVNSVGGDNEAILKLSGTGTTVSSAVGKGTLGSLQAIDIDGTATFDGASEAAAYTVDADTTFTGAVTANTGFTVATDGTDVTLSAASTTGATTLASGTTLTSAGILTTGDLTNTSGKIFLSENANAADNILLVATGELHIGKAVASGETINEGTTSDANSFPTTAKVYLPSNLSSGETILWVDTGGWNEDGLSTVGSTATALGLILQDTALVAYSVAGATNTLTITATDKTATAVATEIGATKNVGTSLLQAMASVNANSLTGDTAAFDAFDNAMKAQNGLSATADTDLALQVAPQTDAIGGSAVATRAMTGTVQGIVSNRMASLRSGDAYVTGMSAGNGMSANSGFIQAFGSEAEQKNTGPTTATVYGYDSQTSGVAIGFDGMTETGETIGLSASFSTTDVDGKGTGKSKNAIDSYTVSVYADKATEKGYIEGSLTYGINDNTSSRLVNTAGLSRTYAGDYDSEQISLKVGGGVPNEVKDGTFVTPFASATGTLITTDSYTETSTTASDALRLKIAQDDINSLVGTIGVKAHMITDKGTPMISFAINNEFGDTTINSTNTYTGGGTAFNTSTDVEELSATLGLGYSFGNDVSSVNIGYEANANEDDYLSHYGTVKIISKF